MLMPIEIEQARCEGCEGAATPGEIMCRGCWERLPWSLRSELGATWRPPSQAPAKWLAAARRVLVGKAPRRSIYRTALTEEEQRLRPTTLRVLQEHVFDRPRTRGDCVDGPRPCPWASCRYNLRIDVTEGGTLKLNHDGELEDMAETCALDVADRGGITVEEAGELAGGLMRGRVGQMERRFRTLLRRAGVF